MRDLHILALVLFLFAIPAVPHSSTSIYGTESEWPHTPQEILKRVPPNLSSPHGQVLVRHDSKAAASSAASSRPGFAPAVTYSTGGSSTAAGPLPTTSVVIADLNADGNPDIVAPNYQSNTVGILLGNGDGTFQPAVIYASGENWGVNSVAVADVNGDGKPDLVVTTGLSNTVAVLLGNGDGTFQTPTTYASGGYDALSVAIVDLNADGKPDLVVGNCSSGNGCGGAFGGVVSVLLGNGDGTFQAAASYGSGGAYATSLVVGDLNGDGKADILVSNGDGGNVGVLLGNGDGEFQPVTTYASGGFEAYSVALSDVNSDGKPDIVVSNLCGDQNCDGSVGVLLGNGDGTFQPAVIYASGGNYAISTNVNDVNNDGKPDILVANFCNNSDCTNSYGSVSVLLGNGDGTFQVATSYASGGDYALSCSAADINHDGKPDIAVLNGQNTENPQGTVGVLVNTSLWSTTIKLVSSTNPSVFGQTVIFTSTVISQGSGLASGTVTFYDGSNSIGIVPLNSSAGATLGIFTLPAGTHNLVTSYSGDSNFAASNSSPLSQQVNQVESVTVVSSGMNLSTYGQPVTFSANVAAQHGVSATGTVTFYDSATPLETVNLSSNKANLSNVMLGTGSHAITAAYNGDNNVLASRSRSLTETVNAATTSTTLVSSANPIGLDQFVTYTTTVTSQYGGAVTGMVSFQDGNENFMIPLSGGIATLTQSYTTIGPHPMTAVYSGDSNGVRSASATLTEYIKVFPIATTTMAVSSNSSVYVGQVATFTANVAWGHGTPPNGELVTFKDLTTGLVLGTSALSGGVATLNTSSLANGTHMIKTKYPGDGTFAASNATVTEVVQRYPTTTTLTSSQNPSTFGQPVTLTATVTNTGGEPRPTGTVTFHKGSVVIGTAALNSSGVAQFTTSTLPLGTHPITASYAHDTYDAGSGSAVLNQTIN